MAKTWFNIRAAKDADDTPVVSVLDYIGYYGVEAPAFLAEYRAAVKGASRVKMQISSPGGDVMQGLAIANGIRAMKIPVDVEVIGIAASMASYLALAVGDTITMPDNTFMFIHDPISGVYGNAEDMRAAADDLDIVGDSLFNGYKSRHTGTDEDLRAMLAAETLLTASECKALGFCDTVASGVSALAAVDIEMLAPSVRDKMTAAFAVAARTPEPKAPTLPPAPAAADLDMAAITALATEHGRPELAPYLATMEHPTREAVTARLVEAGQILAVAKATGYDEAKATRMVRGGKTLVEARKAINAHLQEQDEKTAIDTTPPVPAGPTPSASIKPIPTWAEINAIKAASYGKTPATP